MRRDGDSGCPEIRRTTIAGASYVRAYFTDFEKSTGHRWRLQTDHHKMSISDANPLAYIATVRAPLYRSIMRVFTKAKERFKFQLRLHDISEVLQAPDSEEIESALAQLCEWGNLEARSHSTYVTTIEDFLAARKTFQITAKVKRPNAHLKFSRTTRTRTGTWTARL